MKFSVPIRMSLFSLFLFLVGSICVQGVTYQVEPELPIENAEVNFESICVSANPGLSCVSSADGSLLQPFFAPNVKGSCTSVVVKALISENLGYWKCIVVNVGIPSPANPERVVIFGNDTTGGSAQPSPLMSSFLALGPTPSVEASFGDDDAKSLTVTVNDTVTLNCTSDSATTTQYIWEYRNATNGLWRVFSHAQNLTVTGVFGELWCSGWNKMGPVRSKSTLTIQQNGVAGDDGASASTLPGVSAFLGKLLAFGPPANVEATSSTGEKTVSASILDPVVLTCTSDDATPSRYIWEYRSAATGAWRVIHHGKYLAVRGLFGDVWCTAWNSFGPVRSKSTITITQAPAGPATPLLAEQSPFLSSFVAVPQPPSFQVDVGFEGVNETEITATYNDTINMYCSSNSSHFSRYIWFHRNNATGALRVLKTGQNATVHGLFGEFWCSVWNRFGSTSSLNTLQILHAPEWVEISTTPGQVPIISALKNETVLLSCSSDAYPAPDYRWEKRDSGKPWKPFAFTQDVLVMGKKGGEFVCVANNSLGELRSEEVVIVIESLKSSGSLLFMNSNLNKDGSPAGAGNGAAIVGGGLIAAVLVMLIVLGVTVNKYRRRGTYKELKKTQRPEDSENAGERRALVMGRAP